MKTYLKTLLVVGVTLLGVACHAQNNTVLLAGVTNEEVAEVMEFQDMSIDVVLNNLATQAGLNIHIDSKIADALYGADGKPTRKVTIKWRNLSARQALVAVLDNYNYIATPDPQTKVVRISVKDPAAQEPLVLKVVEVKYANVTNLAALVKSSISTRSQVISDTRGSKLIMNITESDYAAISNILMRVDSAVPQILIEAKFIETAKNPKSVKGIDWSPTLENQVVTFGNGYTSGKTITTEGVSGSSGGASLPSGAAGAASGGSSGSSASTAMQTVFGRSGPNDNTPGGLSIDTARGFYPPTAFLSADGAKVVLSFLNTESDSEFIAQPRAVAMDGSPVELVSVSNVPVFEEEQGTVQNGTQNPSTVKPNYNLTVKDAASGRDTILNEVGVKLLVTPRRVGLTDVFMDLRPEVSVREPQNERQILGGKVNESPIFRRQKLSTVATVPSGNTLVIGGLLTDEISKGYTKVPILGDLPYLGLLFRKDSKSRNKRNMLIFVTPTLVGDGDFQPTPTDFLKTKPLTRPDLDEPAWDSGAPASKYKPLF